MKQILGKTYWQTNPQLKHKASSEEFEACGALKVTIVTANLEYIPAPGWINKNMHFKWLGV